MLTTNQKNSVLIQIAMRLYNPNVMYTYTGAGGNENEAVAATKQVLRQHLTIKPDDLLITALFRMFVFYFVCERYSAAAAPLSLYPVHKDRTRNHLHVYVKPVKKGQKIIREDGRIQAAPYADFSIPHYIGVRKVRIPSYTYGAWTVQLSLKDQSYIRLSTATREEGIKMVLELGKHVDPKFLPDGGLIEKNLRVTEPNQGKSRRLDGVKVKVYKVEFYKFGEENWGLGTRPIVNKIMNAQIERLEEIKDLLLNHVNYIDRTIAYMLKTYPAWDRDDVDEVKSNLQTRLSKTSTEVSKL